MTTPLHTPIIGHEQPIRMLAAAVHAQRLAHAYLFAGPNGIGKRLVAIRWAMAINCEANRTAAELSSEFGGCGSAKGGCRSCTMAFAGTHPDLLVTEPDSQFIKIDQIRDLQEALTLTAWSGRRKVAIIDRAERLNAEAANCLLKTLEEPPPATLLILISAAPDDLLPTLRSRCQLVRFFPLGPQQLAQWLATERRWTSEEAALVSAIAGGCIGNALANNPAQLLEERDAIERWLIDSCVEPVDPLQSLERLIDGAETAAQTPEQFERMLHWLRLWLQDVVRTAIGCGAGPSPVAEPSLCFPSARRNAQLVPLPACCELAAQLHWSWRASFRNLNRQLLLEQWLTTLREAVASRPSPGSA